MIEENSQLDNDTVGKPSIGSPYGVWDVVVPITTENGDRYKITFLAMRDAEDPKTWHIFKGGKVTIDTKREPHAVVTGKLDRSNEQDVTDVLYDGL